jgi:glycine/D-amino acid oxidase-like deaminating enzyme
MSNQESFWIKTARPDKSVSALNRDLEADVLIIGTGIVGTMASYYLAEKGKTVVVLDGGGLAGGVTAHSTAKITSAHGLKYRKLTEKFGFKIAE